MKTNQNGFAAVLAVLIAAVALAGVGAYFYATQTAKQKNEAGGTASWQTYRNTEWGIEIQYPSNWYLKGNEIHNPASSAYLGISRLENPKNLPFDEWWKDSTIVAGRATVLASSEDTIINGVKAKIAYMPEENGWHVHIADNQNHIYSLITEGKVADKQTFDKMLSTFKFINAQAAVAKTEIITYQPHRDGVTQYKTISGDCSVGSEAANRADAYRCITSNEISDPCFVLPNEKLLICGVDIVTGNGGFLLQPAKALPKGELWKNNIQGWAMRLQLSSGEICSFMGGATAGNAKNERLNYQCGDSKNLSMVIYGDLVVGDVWMANVSDIERDKAGKGWNVVSTRTVDIAKLWR